jgi:NAD-dependent SIR2 family protein deacetylase
MTFETKEQVLEKIMAQERPKCPDCQKKMDIWEVPPMSFGDGLGWGTPFLFVCFNEDCPAYNRGWEEIESSFGHNASYRNICYPDTGKTECMIVFSPIGGTGQITTEDTVMQQERIKEATKQGFALLAEMYTTRSWFEVLNVLMDVSQPGRVRQKAAEMVGDIGDLDALDALHNTHTGNKLIDESIAAAIKTIHGRLYTMDCPHCAEVVKQRAKICKHCGKDL